MYLLPKRGGSDPVDDLRDALWAMKKELEELKSAEGAAEET